MNEKETIFISHKSPSDNYFAAWLTSKLKLLGYDVWLEVDELKSGDPFWPEIEAVIRNRAVKFLILISNNYLDNINDASSGIFKELSTADRIKTIKNFKTPIKIDDVNEDNFPLQLMGLNSIDFFNNWQSGLDKLLDSFGKEKIPKKDHADSPLNFWLEAFKIKDCHTNEPEKIYTNWFPFTLPDKLYIHKPIIKSSLDKTDIIYPFIEYSDRHISFFPSSAYPESIVVPTSAELSIPDILDQQLVPIDDFLSLSEPRKKIIELVNSAFAEYLFQSGLKKYEQSNRLVFYFQNTEAHRKRISLKTVGKTNVAVTGKTKENRWSFAISFFSILHPYPCLRVNSHIVFESQENIVLDADEQHQLRRKFGFDWYNRDWLDTLLGMMLKISDSVNDCKIRIPIGPKLELVIDAIPASIDTNFGYFEPEKEEKENA
ncbi:hypothetical protein A3860_23690 [Niastella vici]|uniref:TIR domain-containing protein n=1 Tax=Niastella vici TaxID=1703345 RepID=A0A1V9FYB3_9BACT|nr:toll/interleukin-1 receptor domain-containing protein [Niastella vici]OQP63355.1 hypothetical protein A3860_23690 [Niastella vici]